MTLARPNPAPRYPEAVRDLMGEREQQYVLVDIGARGGFDGIWQGFQAIADFIAFEPDRTECDRLNEQYRAAGESRLVAYPFAIAGKCGRQPLFVTQFPYSTGLYRGNEAWLDRFPFTTLKVVREIEVETTTLDRFVGEAGIDHADFIKIDVEGAEYDVLEGARQMLRSHKVLGIKTEFWWDPVVKGQRSFAEIDMLLRASGFRFFDLQLHYYPRSTLPVGRLETRTAPDGRVALAPPGDASYGQSFTGDALYFRDPVGDLRDARPTIDWDRDALLRLCGLLDAFDYGDCAIEILEAFRPTLLAGVDVDRLIDALVPALGDVVPDYATYRAWSIRMRQMINEDAYKLSDWQPPPTGYRGAR